MKEELAKMKKYANELAKQVTNKKRKEDHERNIDTRQSDEPKYT